MRQTLNGRSHLGEGMRVRSDKNCVCLREVAELENGSHGLQAYRSFLAAVVRLFSSLSTITVAWTAIVQRGTIHRSQIRELLSTRLVAATAA